MKSQSLLRRAVMLVLSAELLCALAFFVATFLHERHTQLRALDTALQGRSDSLLGAIQDAEDPQDNVAIDPAELRLPPEDVYAVYNQGGRLLGASKDAPPVLIMRQGSGFGTRQLQGHSYRVLQREALRIIDREENDGVGLRRPVTIVYAAPMGHLWHRVFEAAGFYALAALLLLCLTTMVLILSLRKLLAPLELLAVEAGGVNTRSLRFVPPASALRVRELRPLAEALSGAIARLRLSFEMEQRFIGDAAHELKTAVAVVRSSIQVLTMRKRTEEEYTAGLQRVLKDTDRAEELLSRMLTLARLEQNQLEQHQPDTRLRADLGSAAERTLERIHTYAEAREVELVAHLCSEMWTPVSGEDAETLVSNLVMNAVQHSPAGSAVKVTVGIDAEREGRVVLAVTDHGSGISAEALPHVFDRFFREDVSRSRETGGAGLGLAICKSIVEAAGGSIAVESRQGEGTTVRVIFSKA